ncbi:MAG: AbrB/MazE/SpoVT family DNA-binding domain-containing protein [Candidatus Hydrothermarchaeales archaeon]
MHSVKLTKKFQVVIPREIRERFGLKIGEKLYFSSEKDKIVIIPERKIRDPLKAMVIVDRVTDEDAVKLVHRAREELI